MTTNLIESDGTICLACLTGVIQIHKGVYIEALYFPMITSCRPRFPGSIDCIRNKEKNFFDPGDEEAFWVSKISENKTLNDRNDAHAIRFQYISYSQPSTSNYFCEMHTTQERICTAGWFRSRCGHYAHGIHRLCMVRRPAQSRYRCAVQGNQARTTPYKIILSRIRNTIENATTMETPKSIYYMSIKIYWIKNLQAPVSAARSFCFSSIYSKQYTDKGSDGQITLFSFPVCYTTTILLFMSRHDLKQTGDQPGGFSPVPVRPSEV